jgi:hypothetical protein
MLVPLARALAQRSTIVSLVIIAVLGCWASPTAVGAAPTVPQVTMRMAMAVRDRPPEDHGLRCSPPDAAVAPADRGQHIPGRHIPPAVSLSHHGACP